MPSLLILFFFPLLHLPLTVKPTACSLASVSHCFQCPETHMHVSSWNGDRRLQVGCKDVLVVLLWYLHCFGATSSIQTLRCSDAKQRSGLSSQAARSGRFFSWRAEGTRKWAAVTWLCKAAARRGICVCICCALVACRALRTWPSQPCAVLTITSGWHLRVFLMLMRCWAELVRGGTPPNPFFKERLSHLPLL